jgi:hypothetical protein
MPELRDHSILIVVESEITQLINALQEAIEREGGEALVVGDHPDAVADTLTRFDFTAAAVNGENQDLVAQLNLPTVIFYNDDAPDQIVARLRRALAST